MTELSPRECLDLISGGGVGRVALCTTAGPQIFPVNFVVDEEAIVFRTAPYTTLGTYGWDTDIAFEVDHIEPEEKRGWSVVVAGRAEVMDDPDQIAALRGRGEPEPFAEGPRRFYLRLPCNRISGRRVGEEWRVGWAATSH